MSNVSMMAVAFSANEGGGQVGRPHHHHHHHRHHCQPGMEGGGGDPCGQGGGGQSSGLQAPERNQFLDFLTAPMQALKGGGNANDKQYDQYLAAAQGGNLLKGF